MGGVSYDPFFNPNLFVLSVFIHELKRRIDSVRPKELYYRVKFGLVTKVHDWVHASHLNCDVTPRNHNCIFHVPMCTLSSYLYIWNNSGKNKQLVWINLGRFLVLRDNVLHGVLCGGEGNVSVHGGILNSIAIETTNRLTYPDSTILKNFNRGHNATHNKKGKCI